MSFAQCSCCDDQRPHIGHVVWIRPLDDAGRVKPPLPCPTPWTCNPHFCAGGCGSDPTLSDATGPEVASGPGADQGKVVQP